MSRLVRLALLAAIGWAFFVWAFGPAWDQELASAGSVLSERAEQPGDLDAEMGQYTARSESAPPVGKHTSSADVVQGKSAVWWARRAIQARRDANARGRTIRRLQHAQLRASGHFFQWLAAADCVHRHESIRWDYNGHTYDGGMQADWAFQTTYAPDLIRRYGGPAYIWPWYAQLQMAYRGWLFRGWQPWPNTSRMCGLR